MPYCGEWEREHRALHRRSGTKVYRQLSVSDNSIQLDRAVSQHRRRWVGLQRHCVGLQWRQQRSILSIWRYAQWRAESECFLYSRGGGFGGLEFFGGKIVRNLGLYFYPQFVRWWNSRMFKRHLHPKNFNSRCHLMWSDFSPPPPGSVHEKIVHHCWLLRQFPLRFFCTPGKPSVFFGTPAVCGKTDIVWLVELFPSPDVSSSWCFPHQVPSWRPSVSAWMRSTACPAPMPLCGSATARTISFGTRTATLHAIMGRGAPGLGAPRHVGPAHSSVCVTWILHDNPLSSVFLCIRFFGCQAVC